MAETQTNTESTEDENTHSFHLDVGNSTKRVLGMCARVRAETREAGIGRLREWIAAHNGEIEVRLDDDADAEEYLTIYLNADKLRVQHLRMDD